MKVHPVNFIVGSLLNGICLWLINRERCGALRFNIVRFIYRMNPIWPDKRNLTWDFVLKYLPHLRQVHWPGIRVLDVGCYGSLLMYEISRRGYTVHGLDMRGYHARLPEGMKVIKANMLEPHTEEIKNESMYSFIVAIGTIELVGTMIYNDGNMYDGDRRAMWYLWNMLEPGGYFLLALPTEGWRNLNGRGYSFGDVFHLIQGLFSVVELTHCGGNICMALAKIIQEEGKPTLLVTDKRRYPNE